ncbi:hypothetical protein [Pseudoalteromonas piscicida]|uniref:hypothetical protein n=1 Tax=Pseudoalteromonas piscicida TaxID=43662 RepID=UPI000E35D76A|nr:hypothetical protein [Pseudoalteromonas piscicida]AXQ98992.1 hypothetical protein D0N37_15550 [Pseudoalteromonas piscicida]
MRPSEVSTQQIVDAGFEIQRTGSTVSGYKLKKVIGKGRPERLMEVWEQEMNGRPEVYDSDEPHVLEPEVEELLAELNEKISKELHGILLKVDKKIRNMADKKVNLIKQDFEVEGQNLYAQIDELEAFVGSLEMDNDKLRMKLYDEQSKPNDQFENEKTIVKLRDRLRGKSELLNERQLRIDELTELTTILKEKVADI